MEWTNEQLIETDRVVAKYENEKADQLLTELATRLDCALAATRVACDQRNALAAENAGLKEYLAPVGLAVEVTPATEAFLAEVRASGVEMFANRKNSEMLSLHPDTHAVGAIASAMSAEIKGLREFAAQLRQGAAA